MLQNKLKFKKTIAIIAGAFKPPHSGHVDMVKKYSDIADNVIILISNPKSQKSQRKTINNVVVTAEMSKKIWQIYISKLGLLNKVHIKISEEPSPVKAAFDYLDTLTNVNVILGVSNKDRDISRFKSALDYCKDNNNINVLDPVKTAVEPYSSNLEKSISASDIRKNINNFKILKSMLPSFLNDDDIKNIVNILNNNYKFMNESADIRIDDLLLYNSKIRAYNIGQMVDDITNQEDSIPVNPKRFPDKAIFIKANCDGIIINIYLLTKLKKWDSIFLFNGKKYRLNNQQMFSFFNSNFYKDLKNKLKNEWPLSDKLYNQLFQAIKNKSFIDNNLDDIQYFEEDGMSAGGMSGISSGDVLGSCDHSQDGFLGDKCFHLPKRSKRKILKRLKV